MSASDRAARATYHPSGYGVSAGLARARLPFRTQNVVTGLAIGSFTFFVYAWSIRAVKQDDFTDVVTPDAATKLATRSIEEEALEKKRLQEEMVATLAGAGGLEKGSKVLGQTKEAFKGL